MGVVDLELFAAEKNGQVAVQPSAPVVTLVDDEGFAVAVFSEYFGVDLAEALAVHVLDVDIANLPLGIFFRELPCALHPAFVKEVVEGGGGDGFDMDVLGVLPFRVRDSEQYPFACLAGEEREVVRVFQNLLMVYLFNSVSLFYLVAREV